MSVHPSDLCHAPQGQSWAHCSAGTSATTCEAGRPREAPESLGPPPFPLLLPFPVGPVSLLSLLLLSAPSPAASAGARAWSMAWCHQVKSLFSWRGMGECWGPPGEHQRCKWGSPMQALHLSRAWIPDTLVEGSFIL